MTAGPAHADAHTHSDAHEHPHPHAHSEPRELLPAGARSTRQRGAVQASLQAAGRPLTAPELLAAAQATVPGLGIATVYRHLKAMQADARVRTLELPGQPVRYEWIVQAHLHHFHCQRCDRVFPLDGCPGHIEQIAPAGFVVERHELTLHGLCGECATASAAASEGGTSA
jgi:Fur family transcriptional regulator, ferric uptake regulator